MTFEKESSKDHSSHSYLIPRALLTAANQWWTKTPRVQSQEMLISSIVFILKRPNARAGHWTHKSTLEGNNIPNWLCSRGPLHKGLCRSMSKRQLCKKGSRRASLEFYREHERRESKGDLLQLIKRLVMKRKGRDRWKRRNPEWMAISNND